jgi:hypothetical protein
MSLLQIAVAIDQLGNTLIGGWADETISARAWRQQHRPAWRVALRVIDGVARLFGQRDHCRKAHESELLRLQSPPATRPPLIPPGAA